MPWTDIEVANLIRGVFRYGECEWPDILDDIEFHPSRSSNMLAIKWR